MKIVVTGASGFIGNWLMRELEDTGHEVQGLDKNPSPNTRVFDKVDLLKPGEAEAWIRGFRPDACIHLAAQVGRLFGEDDVRHTIRSNTEMTTVIGKICGELGIQVVYASTSEIYGDHGAAGCDEFGEWQLPRNLYGLSKRWGEEVLQLYAPENLVICRLSMPYGPGAPPGRGRRALDNFLWQAHHSMPITVHRNAERSWCWVGDTVRGIRLAMEHGKGPYNIGRDDDPRSMIELARMACAIAGRSDKEWSNLIATVDPPEKQVAIKRLATDRIRQLGWSPTVELEEGMQKVYAWVRQFDRDGVRM